MSSPQNILNYRISILVVISYNSKISFQGKKLLFCKSFLFNIISKYFWKKNINRIHMIIHIYFRIYIYVYTLKKKILHKIMEI